MLVAVMARYQANTELLPHSHLGFCELSALLGAHVGALVGQDCGSPATGSWEGPDLQMSLAWEQR